MLSNKQRRAFESGGFTCIVSVSAVHVWPSVISILLYAEDFIRKPLRGGIGFRSGVESPHQREDITPLHGSQSAFYCVFP